jgi:SAM-dependent methyltransferase
MNDAKLYETWDRFWTKNQARTLIGKYLMDQIMGEVRKTLEQNGGIIKHDAKILDVGCGSGRTTNIFRSWGYSNIIGIDNSEESIRLCGGNYGFIKDKDVFVMDGTRTSFMDDEFELLFSEGILEHFVDFSVLVKEMCRVSAKYVLLAQPNHFSLTGRIITFLSDHLRQNVKEYSYTIDDFVLAFKKNGFYLKSKKDTPFKDYWILLFEKAKEN